MTTSGAASDHRPSSQSKVLPDRQEALRQIDREIAGDD